MDRAEAERNLRAFKAEKERLEKQIQECNAIVLTEEEKRRIAQESIDRILSRKTVYGTTFRQYFDAYGYDAEAIASGRGKDFSITFPIMIQAWETYCQRCEMAVSHNKINESICKIRPGRDMASLRLLRKMRRRKNGLYRPLRRLLLVRAD